MSAMSYSDSTSRLPVSSDSARANSSVSRSMMSATRNSSSARSRSGVCGHGAGVERGPRGRDGGARVVAPVASATVATSVAVGRAADLARAAVARGAPRPPMTARWRHPARPGVAGRTRRRVGASGVLPRIRSAAFSADHHHRRVDVAVRHVRHDRRVDDLQAVDAVHAHRQRVDDGHVVGAHLRGARRVQRRLAVAAHPVEDLLVGLDRRAGRGLAAVERSHRRLVEDVAGDADRLDPLAPVLIGGQVVEPQRRLARADRSR